MNMNVFDNSKFEAEKEKYAREAKEKWGKTAAYKEFEERSSGRTAENQDKINSGMEALISEFAECMNSGAAPDSTAAQELVKKWQDFITNNFYTCTKEILAGLGEMYSADERFKANIDRYGNGTAQFMSEAIKNYCT